MPPTDRVQPWKQFCNPAVPEHKSKITAATAQTGVGVVHAELNLYGGENKGWNRTRE